ncbi:hypothetical protein BMT55_16550 [Listeria newyorkensis]|uniref:ABC-2 family transporter protein n=1 Tax=Listeria newyorkensis TaxID=1497681 RepID=A0ABX4XHM9_9LIST|nr:hypothetical protein [Listeria newyorkensis]PNP87044.1 hypothetical protein BMT55_16550 [Listeria newyorkensis]
MEKEIKWSWDETWAVIRGIQVLLSIIITSYLVSEDVSELGLVIFYNISATFLPSILFGNKNISKIVQKKLFKEINTAYYNYLGICVVFFANLTALSLITYALNTSGVTDIEVQKDMALLSWIISPMAIASFLIVVVVATLGCVAFLMLCLKYSFIFYIPLIFFTLMSGLLTVTSLNVGSLESIYCIASFLVTSALCAALYITSRKPKQTKPQLNNNKQKLNSYRKKSD